MPFSVTLVEVSTENILEEKGDSLEAYVYA